MWVSSLSELVPVDPSGSVTHWKNFTGEGGEGEGEGEVKEGRPYFLCHILSEWERQVCVWLSYHLRKVFASVSADSGSHPASLSWWWIIKGPALPKNTDVCTCAHTLQTHMYICMQRHTHTDTKTLSLPMDGSAHLKAWSYLRYSRWKWGLIIQTEWESRA